MRVAWLVGALAPSAQAPVAVVVTAGGAARTEQDLVSKPRQEAAHASWAEAALGPPPAKWAEAVPAAAPPRALAETPSAFDRTATTAALVGCVRDAAPTLPAVLRDLAKLCDAFRDCHMIVYENDSVDGTLGLLQAFAQQDRRLTVLSETGVRLPNREEVLAHCRNTLLDAAGRHAPDVLVVADLDDAAVLGPPHEVLRALRADAWDALAFDRADYYDWYALRCPQRSQWCASAPWFGLQARQFWPPEFVQCDPWGPACLAGLARFGGAGRVEQAGDGFAPVWSAFGGLALYRFPSVKACRYGARTVLPSGEPHKECEHVVFHACLRAHGARMRVADWQLTPTSPRLGATAWSDLTRYSVQLECALTKYWALGAAVLVAAAVHSWRKVGQASREKNEGTAAPERA